MQKNQWYIVLIIAILLLVNNWSIPLWDQDEAAYAGFGYTMNESGNWLVPNFMYSDVHRKPPLHFWNIALSYHIFGYNEFAVRFPSFLAIFGTLMLMFFQGKKFLETSIAFKSIVLLSGTFLVTAIAKVSVTDATVLFTSTLCAFGIINTLRNPNWKWVFLFWLGFALGILTKGPPIIIFSGAFVGLLFITHPQRLNLLKLHPWLFLPVALAPAFLWGYLTYLNDDGVFLAWMYDWYVLQRINGDVFGQTGPIGTHLVAMCVFFLPFLLYIPRALTSMGKGMFEKNETATLLFCWFLAGWLLYEFSPSKLPAYVIAAHVPFAFMIAMQLDKGIPFKTWFDKIFTSFHFTIQIALGLALGIVPFYLNLPLLMSVLLLILGLTLLSINGYVLYHRKNEQVQRFQLGGALLFILVAWTIAPQITQLINSSKRVATYVSSATPKASKVYIVHNFGEQPSLPFYLLKNGNLPIDATLFSNEELLQTYSSQALSVFLLNKEKFEYLNNHFGGNLPYVTVSALIIDRKEKSDYYIVSSPDIRL
jgi:4-amino-4-deoxy-L-arabinose transferase-like glycosyltransferase